ncbi:SERAC1 protein [Danaus plexippus plexippus]|uniref:SERAC1 protein n=2 Tax=Danaus plexippus TaxID=13037 RepID=A0A212FCA7_DANPL|nr:SERAC1 protein [Danaus plexippus plexippus]
MTALFYSLVKNDLHASLCAFGFHFFAAEAILSLNYANGWSTPLRLRHRRFAHVFLQICGLTCVFIGTVVIVTSKGVSGRVHGVASLAATLLACFTFLVGPWALLKGRYLKLLHTTFGIPTFIMSSISLCSGLYESDFMNWSGSAVVFILTGFIIFYTSFIVASSFIKCMMRI